MWVPEDMQLGCLPLLFFELVEVYGAGDACGILSWHRRPALVAFVAYAMPTAQFLEMAGPADFHAHGTVPT